ncbi:hypothetical protein INR77_08710 [Erythrobacter sp. SCSIO 43205]|uniref:Abi-alpha family protein n=1 Tax=Erythrobacter sp. SCSIO 43205 TaxID=2779361 RepID=UPI001CA97F3C|nr:hypothetical protein [Erythrobacter sp. SCSIO 43205]UAB76930.1 hypothetical protein INR77_08710 [Erythrobacter sp. SCSIO 43205]
MIDVTGLTPIIKSAPELDSSKGGVLSDLWHGIVGDRVANWRLKNAASLSPKVSKHLDDLGLEINPDAIPERFAYSWFQKATEEDQPELQELFAKLLANAAAGNGEALNRRNIDLLSRMSPKDALLLDLIAKAYIQNQARFPRHFPDIRIDYDRLVSGRAPPEETAEAETVDSVIAIGILREEQVVRFSAQRISNSMSRSIRRTAPPFPDLNRAMETKRILHLTKVGESLIKALHTKTKEPS